MNINMDFSQRVVIHTAQQQWQLSPAKGVWRKPLEREAKESGHTTSIVKYEAGCAFKAHYHPGGEEIFVIDGVFSDEHGDYPAGSYLRNPPNSYHTPRSDQGCTLFVKLNQFSKLDKKQMFINTAKQRWTLGTNNTEMKNLHQFENEQVTLVKWPAKTIIEPMSHSGSEEILVLSGCFEDKFGEYQIGSWIRNPANRSEARSVSEETIALIKVGGGLIHSLYR